MALDGLIRVSVVATGIEQAAIAKAVAPAATAATSAVATPENRLADVTAKLSADELTALFDLGYHMKHVDTIFDRVFGAA